MAKRKHRIVRTLHGASRYLVEYIIIALLCASLYYAIGARKLQQASSEHHPELFTSDEIVTVKAVIDGDEMLITNGKGSATFRLVGIKSFSRAAGDRVVAEYGKMCFHYLNAHLAEKQVRIQLLDKRLDNRGRLIGRLYMKDNSGKFTYDIGLDLINKGYTQVFTRYHFRNQDAYEIAERNAMDDLAGFWNAPDIKAHAMSLKARWNEEKAKDKK